MRQHDFAGRHGALFGLASAAALSLTMASAEAQTRPPIKAGLWEVQSADPSGAPGMAGANDALARMPPELRKQLEAAMREKGQLPPSATAASGGTQVCVSEESLAGQGWSPAREGCTHEVTSRTDGVWKWRGSCAQPPSTIEGETRFASPTAYTNTMKITVERKGRTITQTMNMNAKWLGADCKGLAPPKPTR